MALGFQLRLIGFLSSYLSASISVSSYGARLSAEVDGFLMHNVLKKEVEGRGAGSSFQYGS